jgi:hypothetical protein
MKGGPAVANVAIEHPYSDAVELDVMCNGSARAAKSPSNLEGGVAASIVGAGIGVASLGPVVSLAEAVAAVGNILDIYDPVGNLSGKTTVAVVAWLVVWLALHRSWRSRAISAGWTIKATIALIVVGVLGTFPPFFDVIKNLLA